MAPIPTDCTSTSHVLHGQYGIKEGRQRDEDTACLYLGIWDPDLLERNSALTWASDSLTK